jgi:ceramide glucosyltransferase
MASWAGRPAGYVGPVFTMPLPLALIVCAAAPAWWPAALSAIVLRFVTGYVVSRKVLRARIDWLLLPAEDLIAFGFWIAGFFGNTIQWRGRRYCLFRDGRFELIAPRSG